MALKISFVFFLASFLGVNLFGQFDWAAQSSGTTDNLFDVFFISKNKGWVVGNNGKILHTSDRGKTWVSQTSGTTESLESVFFIDENTGWAAGGNFVMGYSVILKTTNGGQTWVTQPQTATASIAEIRFLDANNGWAACSAFGGLLKTTNGGTSWQNVDIGYNTQIQSIFFANSSTGWVTGILGDVLKTSNGGASWTVQPTNVSVTLSSIFFVDANTGWAVGSDGTIIKTTNGGTSWVVQDSYVSTGLFEVFFRDASNGYIVGTNGTFLYTADGGSTWNQMSTGTTQNLFGVFFFNDINGWVAGMSGSIRCTTEEENVCLITVDQTSGKNMIVWEKTAGRQTVSYNIYKLVGSQYFLIGNVLYNDMSVFTDVMSAPEVSADRYAIRAVDSEGVESRTSPYHQTMNLGVSVGVPATTITLNWSQYKDESNTFVPDYYYIFRSLTPDNFVLYDSVSSAFTSYNDMNVTSTYYYKVGVSKDAACLPSSGKETVPYQTAFSNSDLNSSGISEYGFIQPFYISPNPASGFVNVSVTNPSINEYTFTLTAVDGREINLKKAALNHLDISEIPRGLYIISLKTKDSDYKQKLIVE